MTHGASGFKRPRVGDVVPQVVDLELENIFDFRNVSATSCFITWATEYCHQSYIRKHCLQNLLFLDLGKKNDYALLTQECR